MKDRFLTRLLGRLLAGLLVFALGACDSSSDPPNASGIEWSDHAEDLTGTTGQRFTFTCPADGVFYVVWGTDLYSDDSSICTAAVHAGRITRSAGGIVTIELRPGAVSYTGSTRNGVTTRDWDEWPRSFVIF